MCDAKTVKEEISIDGHLVGLVFPVSDNEKIMRQIEKILIVSGPEAQGKQ
ncbi:hypothetical protein [Anaerotruncus rubiinfantis]|nr:hypothetical protein [Anaerotruncus rubiinfantis]